MNDIAPELLEKIQNTFAENVAGIIDALDRGIMSYKEAYEASIEIGSALSKAFNININAGILPDGQMYYNIANKVVMPMLKAEHELVSAAAVQAQTAANKATGIGIKALAADFDEDKAKGIIDRVSSEPYDDIKWILDEPVKSFAKNVVDQTIQKNVEFQGKSGLHPKIVRRATAGACKWCQKMAGSYEYPDVPKDVYRRHANCDCTVEYVDGGKIKNVHTKQVRTEERRDIIRETLEPFKHVRFKTGELSPDEYALAKDLWRRYEEQEIPYERGKEALYEEFDNNLTDEERTSAIIHRAVDGYKYTAIHLGHNQYKVIRVDQIDRDPLEAEMRRLFGDEYDKYFNW